MTSHDSEQDASSLCYDRYDCIRPCYIQISAAVKPKHRADTLLEDYMPLINLILCKAIICIMPSQFHRKRELDLVHT